MSFVAIASFFFGLALKSYSDEEALTESTSVDTALLELAEKENEIGQATAENKLVIDELQAKIDALVVSSKQPEPVDLDSNPIIQQCEQFSETEEGIQVKKELSETKAQYLACSNSLERSQSTNTQLAERTKQELIDANASITRLQTDLAVANEKTVELNNQILLLNATQAELIAKIESVGPLEFLEIDVSTNYCRRTFSISNTRCVGSIDLSIRFNFSPNSQMTISMFDPNNDRIAIRNITANRLNTIEFVTEKNKPFLVGQYRIEIELADLEVEKKQFQIKSS